MKHPGKLGRPIARTSSFELCRIGRCALNDAQKWKLIPLLVVAALSMPMTSASVGQEPNAQEAAPQTAEDAAPEAPKQVEVAPVARDEQIAERLWNILDEISDKTDWFSQADVSVTDGVVYLSGEAHRRGISNMGGRPRS